MNPSSSLPQITVKAVILGVVLAAILAGANAYLGLFAGMTVSSAIPAAVISMAVLRLFANSNVLENNIVQTTASAGSSVSAGVVFTVPALYLMGFWQTFDFWWILALAGLGGVLGVLFSVPLRRALIIERKLPFPEGVATGEVLKAGDTGAGVKYLIAAAVSGALAKFGEVGLHLWSGTAEGARYFGRSAVYFGTSVSPALLAVGVIVGLNIGIVVFSGGVLAWYVFVPIFSAYPALDPKLAEFVATNPSALDLGFQIWNTKIRYIGVGSMLIGGVWSLIEMRHSLVDGVRSARAAAKSGGWAGLAETERDIPMNWVMFGVLALVAPIFLLYFNVVGSAFVAAVMSLMMVTGGFLFSAVSSYMAGLVGSSNNPISGMTIATLLFASLVLLALIGADAVRGPAAAILIGGVVCCAAAVGGDNLQDLKAGHIVGATPWKQQLMLAVGALVSAMVMAPVLNLLLGAYGIGVATPGHEHPLAAPQANLMASVAKGVFAGGLPWDMIGLGAAVGAATIAFDKWLERRGAEFRVPVLAAAIGIYLPLDVTAPIFIGGAVAWLIPRAVRSADAATRDRAERLGMLTGAGLIAGEALMGIVMAVPIVYYGDANVAAISTAPFGGWPGLAVAALILWGVYRIATKR
jgi:putative OPT family oligopeptide transporter